MLEATKMSEVLVVALVLVDNDVPRRRWRRRTSKVPPRDSRTFIHPSELPSFSQLTSSPPESVPRHFSSYLWGAAALALIAGSIVLASTERAATITTAMPSHVVTALEDVPQVGREAARSIIEITAESNDHLIGGGAIVVGDGTMAITTLTIAPSATITVISAQHQHTTAMWRGADTNLGVSYLQLSAPHAITKLGGLAATQPVLALTPYFIPSSATPRIAFAETVLSDPQRTSANGVASYLSATSPEELHGLTGSVAVDGSGHVVALYGRSGRWLSASYVADVALTWLARPGCHGRLGITGVTAAGGGVFVAAVGDGPSAKKLQRGDVVTGINSETVDSMDSLLSLLYTVPGRSPVVVHFTRHGVSSYAVVRLGCQA